MPTSPNVNNYHIGKGVVSFKEAGASVFTDLGWMRSLHGALRAQFMFKYTLRPEQL